MNNRDKKHLLFSPECGIIDQIKFQRQNMKIKEVDYSQYTFRRISVNNHRGVETFSLDAGADYLIERYGEEELAEEDGLRVNNDGMLIVTLAPQK